MPNVGADQGCKQRKRNVCMRACMNVCAIDQHVVGGHYFGQYSPVKTVLEKDSMHKGDTNHQWIVP